MNFLVCLTHRTRAVLHTPAMSGRNCGACVFSTTVSDVGPGNAALCLGTVSGAGPGSAALSLGTSQWHWPRQCSSVPGDSQ